MKKLLSTLLVTTSFILQAQAAEVTITATEVWRLRQECEKLSISFSEQIMKYKLHEAVSMDISLTNSTSHYNIKDNRCYIKIEYSKFHSGDEEIDNIEELYDVQTEEKLANIRYSPRNRSDDMFDGLVKYEDLLPDKGERHTQAESYMKAKMSQ